MDEKQIEQVKEDMAEICRKIYEKGLTYSTGGNVSVRIGDDQFLIKPADFCFGDMKTGDFIIINSKGEKLAGEKGNRPSSEWPMHMTIYRMLKGIDAIIHAHSPNTLVFATMGEPIEAVTTFAEEEIGFVPLAPRKKPGSQELADTVAETLKTVEHQMGPPANQPAIACLLEAHGVLVAGKNIRKTFYALESLETTARTLLWMKAINK